MIKCCNSNLRKKYYVILLCNFLIKKKSLSTAFQYHWTCCIYVYIFNKPNQILKKRFFSFLQFEKHLTALFHLCIHHHFPAFEHVVDIETACFPALSLWAQCEWHSLLMKSAGTCSLKTVSCGPSCYLHKALFLYVKAHSCESVRVSNGLHATKSNDLSCRPSKIQSGTPVMCVLQIINDCRSHE